MNKFWTHRAPAIAWAIMLFVLSSISDLPSPIHVSAWDDKLNHVIAYAILGALTLRALAVNGPIPTANNFAFAAVLCIFYGAADEVHQYFVPGRFMDHKDLIANAAGVVAGAFLYLWLCKRRAAGKNAGR